MSGPQVRFIDDFVGCGLFATRNYKKGEFVCFYGGEKKKGNVDGDYCLYDQVSRATHDAVDEKVELGRFINEGRHDNVDAKRVERGKRIAFYATEDIRSGEQFLWYYGPQYRRTWADPRTITE